MVLAQVKGSVVASAKVDSLNARKLLLVEIVTLGEKDLERTRRHMVCVDAVGAGTGELVLVVMGSSARTAPDLADVPADAVIVGIVDSVQACGRELALAEIQ